MFKRGDPYVYRGTYTLKNKLNIKDPIKAEYAENRLSLMRTKELDENPIKGDFDYKHLQDIHKHIFQDMYKWAGTPRTIGMGKSEPLLNGRSVSYPDPNGRSPDNNLEKRAEYAFDNLKKDNCLKDLDKETFIEKLAQHSTDIWEVHAFREGNTRTVSSFMKSLAVHANYKLINGFYNEKINHVRDSFVLSVNNKLEAITGVIDKSMKIF